MQVITLGGGLDAVVDFLYQTSTLLQFGLNG